MMPPRSPRFFGAHLLYVSRYLAAPKNVLPELMPFHGDLLKCVLFFNSCIRHSKSAQPLVMGPKFLPCVELDSLFWT